MALFMPVCSMKTACWQLAPSRLLSQHTHPPDTCCCFCIFVPACHTAHTLQFATVVAHWGEVSNHFGKHEAQGDIFLHSLTGVSESTGRTGPPLRRTRQGRNLSGEGPSSPPWSSSNFSPYFYPLPTLISLPVFRQEPPHGLFSPLSLSHTPGQEDETDSERTGQGQTWAGIPTHTPTHPTPPLRQGLLLTPPALSSPLEEQTDNNNNVRVKRE